eukprot:m.299922 g.299922  ORF g.299922 m.299922 type:complete len:88 (-) comp19551_c0_seq4:1402-1665(-)
MFLVVVLVFPSFMHYIEGLIEVTGRVASVLVIGAALGEMLMPALVGLLLDHFLLFNFLGCRGQGHSRIEPSAMELDVLSSSSLSDFD